MSIHRSALALGLVAGVLGAGLLTSVAAWLRLDEQPVRCPVPDGEVTPVCPGRYGEASSTALALAALMGFLFAAALVAVIRRRLTSQVPRRTEQERRRR